MRIRIAAIEVSHPAGSPPSISGHDCARVARRIDQAYERAGVIGRGRSLGWQASQLVVNTQSLL